jgi:hypothetical protein
MAKGFTEGKTPLYTLLDQTTMGDEPILENVTKERAQAELKQLGLDGVDVSRIKIVRVS